MWELGYGCQLALSQWLCQHRSLFHYDVVVQVLCIIRLEQLSHMYHKSHFHESSIIGTSKHASCKIHVGKKNCGWSFKEP